MLEGFKEQQESSVTSEEGTREKVLGKGHRDRAGLGWGVETRCCGPVSLKMGSQMSSVLIYSAGNLLETRVHGPHPRPTDSGPWAMEPSNPWFHKPPGDSEAMFPALL